MSGGYGLVELFDDVCRKRGRLIPDTMQFSKPGMEYQEVWDTMNRYVTHCLDKKKGVNVSNFFKIGYVKEHSRGQTRLRPYFQLAESFCKAYGIETTKRTTTEKDTTGFEEFNFSKAAIKFSHLLSKDNMFSGLRYIVQACGEGMAMGREMCLDLEHGQLVSRERRAKFVFHASVYVKNGVEAPNEVLMDDAAYRPSATFAPPTKEAYSLRLQGSNVSAIPPSTVVGDHESASKAQSGHHAPPSQRSPVPQGGSRRLPTELDEEESIPDSEPVPSHLKNDPTASEESTPRLEQNEVHDPAIYKGPSGKQEAAYREAMDRYLTEMEIRATEAINDRTQWEEHVERCIRQDREDRERKYQMSKDTESFVQQQMEWNKKKRDFDRMNFIASASSHEFPQFTEPNDAEQKALMKKRAEQMRKDLELQIRTTDALKTLERNKDRELEYAQIVANQNEMSCQDNVDATRKETEKRTLTESWGRESRMRNIMRAIDNHTMTAGPNSKLLDFDDAASDVGSALGSVHSGTGSMRGNSTRPKMGASMSLQKQKANMRK